MHGETVKFILSGSEQGQLRDFVNMVIKLSVA